MSHCFDLLDNDVSNDLIEMIEIYSVATINGKIL